MLPMIVAVLNSRSLFSDQNAAKYGIHEVQNLARMVRKNVYREFDFLCLSDCDVPGVETVRLRHQWPGWWAKLELFRPELQGVPILYFDLDTVIVRDISRIVTYEHEFAILRDFKRPERCQSAIMAWSGDFSYLYEKFLAAPDQFMEMYSEEPYLGDQSYIQDHLRVKPQFLQDLWPEAIESYKVHVRRRLFRQPGRNARIVCFHGEPGPTDVDHKWVRRAMGC